MQVTADNAEHPDALAMLADQSAMSALLAEWAASPPVVEVAVTLGGASVAALLGEQDDDDPMVWVAVPVLDPTDPPARVRLSSLTTSPVPQRDFGSLLDWRSAVPAIEP